ncbi:3-deoxy-manno-octulosonate cytidylyltransferase [Campylobacter corcagiensis]|uniref:3-deoxy-manno-octulosonate cytidylyltransferase n=1 Tax=Campylobacter corcagiensis TaxID=1448857 RepID=A0A7M1LEU7_9BACT|nr:3-deoxy-manno-octulosonate cytidylyltransferase [Campylobacter corcagiensis]QKF64870.1 3-deoxy-D-manno-octulosonate cytidylyltransferase [Campylobacter corcagiensis]QOQ86970.1 3-deoxy-manno-octulosonate cytidylyltransferase [Campylobacter corcagiensis]
MIVIPARLKSTRFPDKILADIFGEPMFIKTAKNAKNVDRVLIAVDDEKVLKIALKYGFDAVMTAQTHQSGTDRINEAVSKMLVNDNEIIINLQADEPFFEIENLAKFSDFANNSIKNGAFMASAYKMIAPNDAKNPNLVKVVCDENSNAIYFSRSIIPYPRSEFDAYKGHIGIYAYSVKSLREFCEFDESILEKTEKLEQLRALSNAKKIAMCELKTKSIGIDTKEDLEFALKNLA